MIDRFAEEPIDADIGAVPLSPVRSKKAVPAPFPAPEPEPTPPRRLSGESSDVPEHVGIHSAADCLILFLESLPEPVVSFAAYSRALRVEVREDAYRVLQSLPIVVRLPSPYVPEEVLTLVMSERQHSAVHHRLPQGAGLPHG